MNNYIFYLLFLQTYYIIFDIFYPISTITIHCNTFTFSSIKTEINPTIKHHQKSIIGNLEYKLEWSKVETEVAFLRLLSPFMASVTGLLFCITQKVLTFAQTLHLSLV